MLVFLKFHHYTERADQSDSSRNFDATKKSLRVWQKHSAFSEENWLPDCYVLACFTQCLLKEAARLFKIAQFLTVFQCFFEQAVGKTLDGTPEPDAKNSMQTSV